VRLRVLLPTEVLLDEEVTKVVAEAENGSFGLLPRHIDFVAALAPGILSFQPTEGQEQFLAIDEGILVKRGPEVQISTRNAVLGPELGRLRFRFREYFQELGERERRARTALAKLEASFVGSFLELGEGGR
jgi:F-type H+-transporting ATPase subunit epsilon